MLWDEELWDAENGWKVDALVDRAEREYGGWDQVVLWNNYPLSGLDDRDQFDYFTDLPGGMDGLRDCVAAFHKRGVRVMLDHKPWVPGRPDGYISSNRALAHLIDYRKLDGAFLDCAAFPQAEFKKWVDSLERENIALPLFCSEAPVPPEHMHYQPWSWCQFKDDSPAPGHYAQSLAAT